MPRGVLTKAEARRLIEATPVVKPRDVRDRAILETLSVNALGFNNANRKGIKVNYGERNVIDFPLKRGKSVTSDRCGRAK